MADAWRSYLEMAYGLTKTSRKKAEKAVRDLMGKSNAKAGELQGMAEDLMASADANRDALTKLIRTELDRALSRVGLVKAEEVAALHKRIDELEAKVPSAASPAVASPVKAEPAAPAGPATPAKAAPAKKTVVKKTAATPPAEPAKAAPAKKTAAKKTVAKKTAAKKAAQ